MGGLRALRRDLCHMASSHLLQEDEADYNFDFASKELERMPAVINFCRREQGILVQKGNPRGIASVADFARPGIHMVNRPLNTGTRLLFDRALSAMGISGDEIEGYHREIPKHIDVGIEILTGRADAAPCIRPVANLLDLDFIPLRWERYDLLMTRERFFEQGVQLFIGMLHEATFLSLAREIEGYDVSMAGKMVFPVE
jgi:molybdate-binding protein